MNGRSIGIITLFSNAGFSLDAVRVRPVTRLPKPAAIHCNGNFTGIYGSSVAISNEKPSSGWVPPLWPGTSPLGRVPHPLAGCPTLWVGFGFEEHSVKTDRPGSVAEGDKYCKIGHATILRHSVRINVKPRVRPRRRTRGISFLGSESSPCHAFTDQHLTCLLTARGRSWQSKKEHTHHSYQV
jgi:hypothetical protein